MLDADRDRARGPQAGHEEVEPGSGADEHVGRQPAQLAHQPRVGPQRPVVVDAVGCRHEHARGDAQQPLEEAGGRRAGPAVVEGHEPHAGGDWQERALARAQGAEDDDLVTLGEVPGEVERRADRPAHAPGAHEHEDDARRGPRARSRRAHESARDAQARAVERPRDDPLGAADAPAPCGRRRRGRVLGRPAGADREVAPGGRVGLELAAPAARAHAHRREAAVGPRGGQPQPRRARPGLEEEVPDVRAPMGAEQQHQIELGLEAPGLDTGGHAGLGVVAAAVGDDGAAPQAGRRVREQAVDRERGILRPQPVDLRRPRGLAPGGLARRICVVVVGAHALDGLRAELLGDRHVDRVVDRDDDERRDVERERVAQVAADVVDRLAAPGRHPEGLGELDEVRVREVDAEVAAELLVLLPDDRAVLAVLPDEVDDRRAQPHRGLELLAVHEEAAVAVDRHDLAVGVHELGRDRARHREAHARQAVGDQHRVGLVGREHAPDPQLVQAHVGDEDVVAAQRLADLPQHARRLDREGRRPRAACEAAEHDVAQARRAGGVGHVRGTPRPAA